MIVVNEAAMTATDLLALAIFGGRRLGEISGIALVLLIVLGFMILARWQRHYEPDQFCPTAYAALTAASIFAIASRSASMFSNK